MISDRAEIRCTRAAGRLPLLCALLLLCGVPPVSAASNIPYGGDFHEQLDELFFEAHHSPGALPSQKKVVAYADFIDAKLQWVHGHVARSENIDKGKDLTDSLEEATRGDIPIALEQVKYWLGELSIARDSARAHQLAADIVTLEYATRSFSEPLESIKIPSHLKNMIFEWRSPSRSRASQSEREASNLVDPATGRFLTPDEIAQLLNAGYDLSTFDPPKESPFWRAQENVSRVDIVANYLEGGDPVHEGIVSKFPTFDGAIFELQKVHKTQTKPKLDVWYSNPKCAKKSRKKQKRCRKRIKLKFGMETHADPPANALLAAFGYNVDVSMHLRNVKIYLGDHSLEAVKKEWIGYFDQQRLHTYIPLESVLLDQGEDERGPYLVFQETVAELKPDEIVRVGFFPFSQGVASQFREARALFLFNAWIGNADMKDDGNNKVALRRGALGKDARLYMIQQDLGHALGWVLPERPEAFPWDLIEDGVLARVFGAANGSIELDYVDLQYNGLLENATYADNKWMARKIAALTRDQISTAIDLGVWPGGIGQLYIEKLINRRNQIVEAFGLADEFAMLPVDRELTTTDGSVVDGHLVQSRFPEHSPIDYGHQWRDLLVPVFSYLREAITGAVQSGIGAVDVINPGDIGVGTNLAILPRILLKLSREVVLNPEPEGAFDQYIVIDSMDFGLRVGVGYIGSADGAWMKRVTLAYPVATHRRGLYGGVGAMNFLRNDSSRAELFPDRYVLYREDLVKSGLRVSSDSTSLLSPLGVDGSLNWVSAHRSVIDHRRENPIVWIDEPQSIESQMQLFFEFFDVLQVPFWSGRSRVGQLEGRLLELDAEKLGQKNAEGEVIFDSILHRGDFSDADQILTSEPRHATSNFSTRDSWWSMLLVSSRFRALEETITLRNAAGETIGTEHQAEERSRFHWSFLDNAESHRLRVGGFLSGSGPEGAVLDDPTLVLSFRIDDKNAHSDEFNSYYRLLEGLGAGERMMAPDFAAEDWEIGGKASGRWSRLLTHGSVHLYAEALEALMRLDAERHWTLLAKQLGISRKELDRQRWLSAQPASKASLISHRRPGALRLRQLILRSEAVLSILEQARKTAPGRERLERLVHAFYRVNFRSGNTFDPILLATLLQQADMRKLIDQGSLRVEGRITRAFEDEQNMPERNDVVGNLGTRREFARTQYRFFPFTGLELYNMLNWSRGTAD